MPTPLEISAKIEIPENDKFTPIGQDEAEFIYQFLKEKKLKNTLEIGFAYARSTSHIIAATESPHIAIDPYQKSFQNLGTKNIEVLGLSKLLDHRNDFSHNVLPKLLNEGEYFDFIFIDGDHKFDFQFVDFYYSALLLKNDGFLLLHDSWMRSTRLLMSFIERNRKDFTKINLPLKNLALYQKTGKDLRDGMNFKEFYTLRSILTHALYSLKNRLLPPKRS